MFERFTDRARRVVVLSQEEARLLNHNYIGTEHLLLGMLADGEGLAARVLESLGVELLDVRAIAANLSGAELDVAGHLPFTRRAKKAIELSLSEAIKLEHNYIGTEHIMLGIIRVGTGNGFGVLKAFGVDPRDLRASVLGLIDATESSHSEDLPELLRRGEPRDYAKSGSPYEERYGFSRAVRHGNRIEVAGTAPIPAESQELGKTAYDQMLRCGVIVIAALTELGASAADVIRTVMYITDPTESDEIGRAHAELFGEAAPAATMVVVAGLLEPDWKVELEVSAQV